MKETEWDEEQELKESTLTPVSSQGEDPHLLWMKGTLAVWMTKRQLLARRQERNRKERNGKEGRGLYSLLPPKASAEGGLYLNGNWLLWSVYDGLLWSVYDGLL